jgi:hypothetical protein
MWHLHECKARVAVVGTVSSISNTWDALRWLGVAPALRRAVTRDQGVRGRGEVSDNPNVCRTVSST